MLLDPLSPVLAHITIDAGVFYSGNICGMHDFDRDERCGHLHLVRQGRVELVGAGSRTLVVDRPTLLFLPRAWKHQLIATQASGADVTCATVTFGGSVRNPIAESLPDLVEVQLDSLPGTLQLLELMLHESNRSRPGSKGILDRLCEVLIINLLRHCMDQQLVRQGTLAGLTDRRLAAALNDLHASPQTPWDLVSLADRAGMSRSRFAKRFRDVTGQTPADYLAGWRVQVAQGLLLAGKPVKAVAAEVGYGSTSALSRVFSRKTGEPPSLWLARQRHTGLGTSDHANRTQDQREEPVSS